MRKGNETRLSFMFLNLSLDLCHLVHSGCWDDDRPPGRSSSLYLPANEYYGNKKRNSLARGITHRRVLGIEMMPSKSVGTLLVPTSLVGAPFVGMVSVFRKAA